MFVQRNIGTALRVALLTVIAWTTMGAEDCLKSAKEGVETVQEEAENLAEQVATARDLEKIDNWLRQLEPDSQPYDWLEDTEFESCDEIDLVEVLRAEIDPQAAPGLTYKAYILDAIYEEELVHEAYKQFTPTYEPYASAIAGLLVDSTTGLPADFAIEGIQQIAPAAGLGLSTLAFIKQIHDTEEIFDQIEKDQYVIALGTYFRYRSLGSSEDDAWNEAARLIESLDEVSGAQADERGQILNATRSYFESLWLEYMDDGRPQYGLLDSYRQTNRDGIRALLLYGLEKHRPGC
jgi:hypothetical protein